MDKVYPPNSQPSPSNPPGNTIFKWFLVLVVLGIAGTLIYWLFAKNKEGFEISLISKEGIIEYRMNESEGWKELTETPFILKEDSEVRTLEESSALISFADGSEVRMDSFTRIVLIENGKTIQWVQTDGNTHHQLIAGEKEYKEYIVSFSEGEVKTIGTAFQVRIGDTETEVLALKNNLEIEYKDETIEEIMEGTMLTVSPVGKRSKELEEGDLRDEWTLNNLRRDLEKGFQLDSRILQKAGISGEEQVQEQTQEESKEEEKEENKEEEKEEEKEEDKSETSNNLTIEAKRETTGVTASWKGAETSGEWKLVRGTTDTPVYPEDYYRSINRANNSYTWEIDADDKTWYFRVCIYEDGKCTSYSNAASVKIDKSTSEKVYKEECEDSGGDWSGGECDCPEDEKLSGKRCIEKEDYADSVSLTKSVSGDDVKLKWNISGGDAPYGYAIVRDDESNPKYPDNKSKKAGKDDESYTWKNLDDDTYHFRVCVLDDEDKCEKYSNDVKVEID